MKMKTLVAASALVAALAVATPAMAQQSVTEAGDGSADGNISIDDTANDFLDLLSNNSLANGNDRDNVDVSGSNLGSTVGNTTLTALQLQVAVINNNAEVVSFDGDDSTDYSSGDNSIGGSSFAAFAGINNLTQNSGINNINQSGVNMSAQGTVNIGGPN